MQTGTGRSSRRGGNASQRLGHGGIDAGAFAEMSRGGNLFHSRLPEWNGAQP